MKKTLFLNPHFRNITNATSEFSLYSTERNTEEQGDTPQPLAAYLMNAFEGLVFVNFFLLFSNQL